MQDPPDLGGEGADRAVREALAAALAPRTRRTYRRHWAAFRLWCTEHGPDPALPALPALPSTVAAHLAAIAPGMRPATLQVRRAAIGSAHRAAGHPDPTASALVRRTLAGLRRAGAVPQQQARPLGLAELAAIRATATRPRHRESPARATARGRLDRALCAVLLYAGLRRSEAAALTWADLETRPDGSGLLWVRRSKTDPHAAGEARYLPRSVMAELADLRPEDTAEPDPAERVFGIGERQISRRVAAAARAAGLGEGFSGHSGRVGLAVELARAGASTHEIAAAAGWRSATMVLRYTRREEARRGAVARYLADPPATSPATGSPDRTD